MIPDLRNIELVYSGLIDGYKASTFHEKCDLIGETLTIVKSKKH